MLRGFAVGGSLAIAATVLSLASAEEIKSGLEVGKTVSAFHPLNVTGAKAGQKHCLV